MQRPGGLFTTDPYRWWFQTFFMFIPIHPYLGKWSNLMGWNHQLGSGWHMTVKSLNLISWMFCTTILIQRWWHDAACWGWNQYSYWVQPVIQGSKGIKPATGELDTVATKRCHHTPCYKRHHVTTAFFAGVNVWLWLVMLVFSSVWKKYTKAEVFTKTAIGGKCFKRFTGRSYSYRTIFLFLPFKYGTWSSWLLM